jgi:hypothetical protein
MLIHMASILNMPTTGTLFRSKSAPSSFLIIQLPLASVEMPYLMQKMFRLYEGVEGALLPQMTAPENCSMYF